MPKKKPKKRREPLKARAVWEGSQKQMAVRSLGAPLETHTFFAGRCRNGKSFPAERTGSGAEGQLCSQTQAQAALVTAAPRLPAARRSWQLAAWFWSGAKVDAAQL